MAKVVHARATWGFMCTGTLANTMPEQVVDVLQMVAKNWTFAQYKNMKFNTVFLRGRMSLKSKLRPGTLMSMLGDTCLSQISLTPTMAGPMDPAFYETDQRELGGLQQDDVIMLQGPWSDITAGLIMPLYVQRMVNCGMHPWQLQVMKSIEQPDERAVNFVVDEGGKRGKSSLGMYLLCKGLGRRLPPCLSYKDVMRKVMDTPVTKCFIVDLPRTIKPWKIADVFSAVEEIKNGHAWDDRYQWKEKTFEPPAVWMFANSLPDLSMLSSDRWKVWRMRENVQELEPYYAEGVASHHPHPVLRIACAPSAPLGKRKSNNVDVGDTVDRSVVAKAAEDTTALNVVATTVAEDTGPTTENEWAEYCELVDEIIKANKSKIDE